MRIMRPSVTLERSLKKLGSDIRSARLRRRLMQSLVAERAGISLNTLAKIERGDPGVGIGNVAAVLWALGFGAPFSDLVSAQNDATGLLLEEERLPARIRKLKIQKPKLSGT